MKNSWLGHFSGSMPPHVSSPRNRCGAPQQCGAPQFHSRMKLRQAAGLVLAGSAAATGLALLGAYTHARHYVVRHRKIVLGEAHPCTPGTYYNCATAAARAPVREPIPAEPHIPTGSHRVRIVHFSDFHLRAGNKKLLRFIESLADVQPDMLVFTGDLICQNEAIEPLLRALEPYRGCPGFYVYGSNDYYQPRIKNPAAYLFRNSNEAPRARAQLPLSTHMLTDGLDHLGFINLNNSRAQISVQGITIDAVGVDDPHMNRDRYPERTASLNDSLSAHSSATLYIGLTHAPYTRILNCMSSDGCSMIFAGHTHGGQICLPGYRAIVTNCDLPPHYASGLFPWPENPKNPTQLENLAEPGNPKKLGNPQKPGNSENSVEPISWVNISAGLGTAPFFPFRTWCPPEACILDVML